MTRNQPEVEIAFTRSAITSAPFLTSSISYTFPEEVTFASDFVLTANIKINHAFMQFKGLNLSN
tara:strand:- start:803 stop:994 length:192 start_codon:yes stop_codon:yes gene_type:complete